MHAGVAFYQFRLGKMDEAISIWRAFLPQAANQRGFKGAFLLTDPKAGKGIGIALWETEADASAFETSGLFPELVAKLGGALAAPPVRELYELSEQG
jgi:heme-degrading monooxygenase HmoA